MTRASSSSPGGFGSRHPFTKIVGVTVIPIESASARPAFTRSKVFWSSTQDWYSSPSGTPASTA